MPIYLGDYILGKGGYQIFQELLNKGYELTLIPRDMTCHHGPLLEWKPIVTR